MKTWIGYLLVAAAAAGMAWALFHDRKAKDEPPAANRPPALEDPLWYRSIDGEERLAAARLRLDRMATTLIPATEAGPVKDELALLCRDEAVVAMIVDDFGRRRDPSPAQLSALMEVMSRVRHPSFVPLVNAALEDEAYEVRSNAAEAARVQAHPGAIPGLRRLLAGDDPLLRRRAVLALAAIGTDEACSAVARSLSVLERDAALDALTLIARTRVRQAIPAVRGLLRAEDPDVRTLAGWALASLGLEEGSRVLEDMARNDNVPFSTRAQAIQLLVGIDGVRCIPTLEELAGDAQPMVAFEARCGLLGLGDLSLLPEILEHLDGEDPGRRRVALAILGRSGRAEDLERVRPRLPELALADLDAFLKALGISGTPGALDLLEELAGERGPRASIAIRRFHDFGVRSLDALERLLEGEEDPQRRAELVAALASIPAARSREILEDWAKGRDRKALLLARSGIRRLDLNLLLRPPS